MIDHLRGAQAVLRVVSASVTGSCFRINPRSVQRIYRLLPAASPHKPILRALKLSSQDRAHKTLGCLRDGAPALPRLRLDKPNPHATTMGRYPWAEYFLFEVLYITFFYPTRQRAYRVVALTAMVHLAAQIYLSPEATDSARLQSAVGFMVATRLMFIAYVLLAEGPFPDGWRRLRDEVREGTGADNLDKAPSNFPLTKKLWWMVDIAWGTRMIGWVQEPRGMPPHPPPSRRTFLWKTSSKFIKNFIIADLATSVLALSPAFDNRVHDPTDGPETYLAAVPLLHRVPYVLSWIVEMATSASATQNIIALVCVGLGYSSPTLWPDAWGSWRDAYTVRKLWGYAHPGTSHSPHQITRLLLGERGTNDRDRCEHPHCVLSCVVLRISC